MKNFLYFINVFRLWPIYLVAKLLPNAKQQLLKQDMHRWVEWKNLTNHNHFVQYVMLMTDYKEYRNILFYRMGKIQYLLRWLCPPINSLFIYTKNIGGGFLIQHGFATIVNAEHIGQNCKVFQQVTIGYNGTKRPWIGDDVEICCGAKIIGGVHIANNVIVGAQALVVKDIPANVVVGGVPAKVIKSIPQDHVSNSI